MGLLDSLVAYWKLDETSGTRYDNHGSNDLADVNTVGYAAGVLENSALFVRANQEYLSKADNADLSVADVDFTFSLWVYGVTWSNDMGILGKNVAGTPYEYDLMFGPTFSSRLQWRIFNSAGSIIGVVLANALGLPSINTWYHVVVWHDASGNEVGIRVDDTYENTAATTGVPFDGVTNFTIGALYLPASWAFNGRVDEVGFWKRLLTADEKTRLYNGGAGLAYPFRRGYSQGIIVA